MRLISLNRIVIISVVCLFLIGTAQAATFTVTSTADGHDSNTGDGVCFNPLDGCTFRAAIEEANATAATDDIAFSISGAGVKTLTPASPYPDIINPVFIDGWTQGGANFTGPPLIELNGTNAGSAGGSGGVSDGLVITGGNSTIRGLIINRFVDQAFGQESNGIVLRGNGSNVIRGCYIGTNSSGTIERGNNSYGIIIEIDSPNNVIGGTNANTRNLISGNGDYGIGIHSSGNQLIGNYIGTDITGTVALSAHFFDGVKLIGDNNIIGGAAAGEGNVISGNNSDGISVYGHGNQIKGNYIGTDASGTNDLGNGHEGVAFPGGNNNTLGGISAGEGNVIAFNQTGVVVSYDGTGNQIRGNTIFNNDSRGDSLGIDLTDFYPDGVTPNDNDDNDTGGNGLQNFPVVATALTSSGGVTSIEGNLNSKANIQFAIDFYSNTSCDSSGNGEGNNYFGSTTATTDASGNVNFTFAPTMTISVGQYITVTATRMVAPLSTSEFSECVQVTNPAALIVTNTNDSGPGSLRHAIVTANSTFGLDIVRFDMPGAGVKTINLLSPLPPITDPVIINGNTQPGFAGFPLIELNGAGAGAGADGLNITAGESTIKGLIINRFDGDGIEIFASSSNTVTGCFIGTDASGTIDLGNSLNGIRVENSAANRLGGALPTSRNLISGNNLNGILLSIEGSTLNAIVGNFIGTDSTGTIDLGNSNHGIEVSGALSNAIGGTTANLGNLISGNDMHGIRFNDCFGNLVKHNLIGTNAGGTADLGNTLDGILLGASASNNVIGTETSGNTIAFNQDGVNVLTLATGNAIRGNSIFSNDSLGIDLAPNGVTTNDLDDADAGANNLQNFPVLTKTNAIFNGAFIEGSLNSVHSTEFTIDFFSNPSCDSSGNGEGRTYIGSKTVTTDAGGDIDFSFSAVGQFPVGSFVTTTATRATPPFDTSEFSQCRVVAEGQGNLTFSASTYSVNENAATRTITVNRTDGNVGQITVNYATTNGTATAGQDYSATSGTLTFSDGEIVKTFEIPITNDTVDELDETVNLLLSNPSPNVSLTPNSTAVLTIDDNDNSQISIIDVSLEESNVGTSQFTFTVQLSGASNFPITVDYVTANGTATVNSDYFPTSGQLSFAPGETSKTVSVTVLGDLTVELNETFFVNLSNPTNAAFGDNQGLGTIIDDDNPGRFSFTFSPYSGVENTSVLVTVARTNGDAGTVSVDYATSGGSATASSDYTRASGTLIFGDGEITRTFSVTLLDDTLVEPTENFNVVLSNPIGGASLGVPSTAAVNILDNDTGALFAIKGTILKTDSTPLIGTTVNLTGTQTGTITTNNLGKYSFDNLAPNGNYSVAPAALGFTFNPINRQYNNLSAIVTNADFTATAAPSRQLRIIGGNAAPTQNITAVVELVAQGDENSVGFSMNFDQTILMNPTVVLNPDASTASLVVNNMQAGAGKLGIILALPSGTSFAAGTKSLVTVTFNTVATNLYTSPVTFGDVPTIKEVANNNADALPTNYLDGAVTFAQGWEADLAPRPTGTNNGTVTVADFTQVGRFAAGLDTDYQLNEFQRADCAPRVSLGNGIVTVADYTQAGRYAANLDPAIPTGGVSGLMRKDEAGKAKFINPSMFIQTVLRVVNAQAAPNGQVLVSIETDAQGSENGFGFTLNYDNAKLSNPLVTLGSGVPVNTTLIPNTMQAGKAGVILGLPFGVGLTAGTKQLVTIRFNVASNAAGGPTALTLGDAPVVREVSDVNSNVLPSTFQNGAINITAPTAALVSVGGRVRTALGNGINGAVVTLNGGSLTQAIRVQTSSFGYYKFDNVPVGATYVLTVGSKRYTFTNPTVVVSLNDQLTNADFVAEE